MKSGSHINKPSRRHISAAGCLNVFETLMDAEGAKPVKWIAAQAQVDLIEAAEILKLMLTNQEVSIIRDGKGNARYVLTLCNGLNRRPVVRMQGVNHGH